MSYPPTESIAFHNATLLDGSGSRPVSGHVLVADGRIRQVGTEAVGADREIDLDGSVLAPGFIDMHAHSELRLFEKPEAAAKLTQGVTTEVLGQDGVSVAPVPSALRAEWETRIQSLDGSLDDPWPWTTIDEYLAELEAARPAVNCAYYVPHGNLRSHLAGFDDRPLDKENPIQSGTVASTRSVARSDADIASAPGELGTIQAQLSTALDNGAFGLSTGLIYPPSSYARDDELLALARTLAGRDSLMISHVWNETDHVVESIDRYLDICHRGGCHAHVSHLKVGGERNWGDSRAILDLFDAAEARGQRVSFDQYPYTAGSTMLTALLPPWVRQGESAAMLDRLRDPESRERIADDIETDGDWENLARAAGTWDNILLTRTASGTDQGKTLAEIAAERGLDPVDTLCEILIEEALDVTMADFIMAESDIERFVADPRGTFCTDGIFGGKPHPRAIGTFPRIIERYVRDRAIISPAEMVYKAAGRPADILGLPDRGYLKEGYVADLVAFDPEAVVERATYEQPVQLTDSIEYVLVGGAIAVEDGTPTGVRNGAVLRSAEEWDGPNRPTYARGANAA